MMRLSIRHLLAVAGVALAATAAAAAAGVWGVPTMAVGGQLFWGADTLDFMNAFLADPALFEAPDMRRADAAEIGVSRRI